MGVLDLEKQHKEVKTEKRPGLLIVGR